MRKFKIRKTSAYLNALYNRLPDNRLPVVGLRGIRCKGYSKLALRKLIAPYLQFPLTLQSAQGARFYVSNDPVDELIVGDMLAAKVQAYFPPIPIALPECPLILDIGAHHGFYAVAALERYSGSRVICVEPSAEAVVHIQRNLHINGWTNRARIVQAALSDQIGNATLKRCGRGSWGNSLYEDDAQLSDTEEVSLLTLAEILRGEEPHIVKCNAEGGEYALSAQLLQLNIHPLLLIVMVHKEFGEIEDVSSKFGKLGYRIVQGGSARRPWFHFWREDVPLANGTSGS